MCEKETSNRPARSLTSVFVVRIKLRPLFVTPTNITEYNSNLMISIGSNLLGSNASVLTPPYLPLSGSFKHLMSVKLHCIAFKVLQSLKWQEFDEKKSHVMY